MAFLSDGDGVQPGLFEGQWFGKKVLDGSLKPAPVAVSPTKGAGIVSRLNEAV